MLDAAAVLVDRQPPLHRVRRPWMILVSGRGVPKEVPGRIHERVHRVGLASGRPPAGWARHVHEVLFLRQGRLAVRGEVHVVGQQDGQVRHRHGHLAARGTVDDRDGRPPVPLARDQPVAQAVGNRSPPQPLLLQPFRHDLDRLRGGRPVERTRADHDSFVGPRLGHDVRVQIDPFGLDHHADLQAVGPGELEIALIVPRHSHDGARAVLHQHVGRHEAGHPLPVHGIDRVHAQEDSLARQRFLSLGDVGPLQPVLELLHALSGTARLGQLRQQRVLGREHEERHAP